MLIGIQIGRRGGAITTTKNPIPIAPTTPTHETPDSDRDGGYDNDIVMATVVVRVVIVGSKAMMIMVIFKNCI